MATQEPASSLASGPVAGGVIGGIILVFVILIAFAVVIYLVLRHRGKLHEVLYTTVVTECL